MSPSVSVVKESPAAVLATSVPSAADQARNHITVTDRTLDAIPSLDAFFPYIPPTTNHHSGNTAAGRTTYRAVVLAAKNSAGTTNVYAFQATFLPDAKGNLSAASNADKQMITRILATLQLPANMAPALLSKPRLFNSCNSVCWATNNWNYNKYNDSSAQYCDSRGFTGNYGNFTCIGTTYNGVQAPSTGYTQPYFQCAEFVARALSQDGDIPGLVNSGVNGSAPPTPTIGSYSYGNFPMTYMGASYSSDTIYFLTDTGTNSIMGLYQYLTSGTMNGQAYGTNLGSPVSVSAARAGDVVFFYAKGGTIPTNLDHVMLITSAGGSTNNTILVGHDVDDHNVPLANYANNFAYQILQLKGYAGSYGNPTLSGTWNFATDGHGQGIQWAYTGCTSCNTAGASFTYAAQLQCAFAVYVPQGNATAQVNFGVYNTGGGSVVRAVNENAIDGWALLYRWGELSSAYDRINVSNNTGTSGQQLGVGEEALMC